MTTGGATEARDAGQGDLTAKARIRNAALELFAAKGLANTSIREVATAAGVTHGLVVHHFVTKDGLRRAVREHVIDVIFEALGSQSVPTEGTAAEIRRARDKSVDRLFTNRPELVAYIRRVMLDPAEIDVDFFAMSAEFTLAEIRILRSRGLASTATPDYMQAMTVFVREIGRRLLAPAAEHFWDAAAGADAGPVPELKITIKRPPPSEHGPKER